MQLLKMLQNNKKTIIYSVLHDHYFVSRQQITF